MHRKTTLENGLRIVTKKLEGTKAVTVLVLVGGGSRYETRENNGISHFLEHMFFKGAKRFPTTKAVSEAIDAVGGDFNAFTGKEYVGYFVKVVEEHQDIAMDVLSDMLINAKFEASEIEKERGVIMEEFNMYQDTPIYQVGWDFERLMFGDQPMGWDQVGTKDLILGVKQEDFRVYKNSLYTPDNIVISIVGDLEHKAAVSKIEQYFKFDKTKKAYNWKDWQPVASDKVLVRNKKTEQAHLVLGVQAYPEEHPDHYAERLLAIILGGNMSSRMFLSVREQQGLAYYIQTSTDDYQDIGVLSTRAGVDLKRVEKAVTAIIAEYKKIRDEAVPKEELKKAKDFIKGKMFLRLEDSEEYAHLLGKQELLHNKIETPQDIIKKIEKVKEEDIKRVAEDLFKEEKLKLAVIGPFEGKEMEKGLKF